MIQLLAFLLIGHAPKFQVCTVEFKALEIQCMAPETRTQADLKALVINTTAGGQGVAWVIPAKKAPKAPKHPAIPPDVLKMLQGLGEDVAPPQPVDRKPVV